MSSDTLGGSEMVNGYLQYQFQSAQYILVYYYNAIIENLEQY
jgi:hypothetical protein